MARKWLDNLDSDGGDVVPEGEYDVEVVDARALEDKAFIWLDLKILTGPDAERVVSVSLNVPGEEAQRGALFFFRKKVRGFAEVINAANAATDDDLEFAAQIADTIVGRKFLAGLSVQSEGAYEGSQQLDYTKGTDAPAPPVTPRAETPVAIPEVAEAVQEVAAAAVAATPAPDPEEDDPF